MATRYITAQEIINRAAVECGLNTSNDVFASTDPAFIQFRTLINSCGQDLLGAFDWEYFRREHAITTNSLDTGEYDLPDDFDRMINQTHWDRTNDNPVAGPLSPQQWAYLKGRDLINSSIYVSFRVMENTFHVYPDNPVPDGLDIRFEYISRNWVIPGSEPDTFNDVVEANSDVVLYKPVMIVQYLRYKFLDAKGFDTASALGAFTKAYLQATGGNKGAPILNAGRRVTGIPLLDHRNVPLTNFGS